MPVLSTLLLRDQEISLVENMEKFKATVKLNSMTQSELFVKNAMKNNDMHARAVEIITEHMEKILNVADHAGNNNHDPILREYNTDTFL